MLKIADINKEIKQLESLHRDTDEKELKRAKKKVQLLITCRMYLQSKPDRAFIEKEIKRLENRINLIASEFADPVLADKKTASKLRKEHESEYGVGHLRTQLRTLRMILK